MTEWEQKRQAALAEIAGNIASSGYHLYVVSGLQHPRWAYTIGLSEGHGAELILMGGISLLFETLVTVVRHGAKHVAKGSAKAGSRYGVPGVGSFSLGAVHSSWPEQLIAGATDYYQRDDIPFLQVIPEGRHRTREIPDMSGPWSPELAPAWRWLVEPWPYEVPKRSSAVTELEVFRGAPATHAWRWELDDWEIFSRHYDSVPRKEVRMTGIGVLLAIDHSLTPVLDIPVGKGVWREDADSPWQSWE